MTTTSPLEGRRALVTGASAGIGAATARQLVAAGAQVVLAARRAEKLAELAAELGPAASILALDVRDGAAVEAALSGLDLDLLVLNAGLARGTTPAFGNSLAELDDMIDTNVKGYLHVLRACLPQMLEGRRGDVVLLGSVAGRQVYPGGGVYCMTKHAVRALYESLRIDGAGRGVRFTTVDPGMVETDFSKVRFEGDEAKAAAVYAGMQALAPEDIADVILFAVTRPPHVNLGEIVVWPTDQASTTLVRRD
ncbi:MAG: SDR family NAD(P)-dependent oxidoreductase [Planctomycetota bacterium]|nr:SDR family NAD(P)-dependent oxidoreductase [Planctomycetota bacterium]